MKEWQKVFDISHQKYQEWKKHCSEESVLTWALKNKKIDVTQYLKWAKDHFRIPLLNDSFFKVNTIQFRLWKSIKELEQWHEFFLPIHEWKGIVFAGCLEPPKITNKSVTPILVSPEKLTECWDKIQTFPVSEFTRSSSHQSRIIRLYHSIKSHKSNKKRKPQKNKETKLNRITKFGTAIFSTFSSSSSQTSIKDKCANILEQADQIFFGSIIFSYNKKEQFTPIVWSSSLNGPAKPTDTDIPSIFKIIKDSHQLYHGFIIKNKIHDQFFNDWGFDSLPQQVTLIPIFRYSQPSVIVGAFMGIAKISIHPTKLKRMINVCSPLEKYLATFDAESMSA